MRLEATSVEEAINERQWRSGRRIMRTAGFVLLNAALATVVLGHPSQLEPFASALRALLDFVVGSAALGAVFGVGRALVSRNLDPRKLGAGSVVVDDDALSFGEAPARVRLARANIASGFVDARGRAIVDAVDGTELRFATNEPADAHALLAALGLDASSRTATFRIASAASESPLQIPWTILVGLACMLALVMTFAAVVNFGILFTTPFAGRNLIGAALTSLLGGAFLWMANKGLRSLASRRVTVGTDGVLVRGATTKLIPFSSIARVAGDPGGVTLIETNGRAIRLPYRDGDEGLGERIEEAIATRGKSREALIGALERGEATIGEWRRRLREALLPREGYREARVDADDLVEVVEDAAAPVERRIAAAFAVGTSADEGAKKRVRIAAAASTDEELRRALEEAAEGELDESRLARAAKVSAAP